MKFTGSLPMIKTTSVKVEHFGKGGTKAWRQKVDAVKLDSFTAADVVAWKNERIRSRGKDPIAKKQAQITANSIIRNARGLMGKKILPFLEQTITLPSPLPFAGVPLEKAGSMRYISKIDPYQILAEAKEELSSSEPEAFKILVLALVCGLRRGEIDNLLWRAFDFNQSTLKIETSEYHQLKSDDSAGTIDLDSNTKVLFQNYRKEQPDALFVVNSVNDPTLSGFKKAVRYRCNSEFSTAIKWLKSKGVKSQKPIHTLRKEIGSIIASEHGIFAASRYLRHADIQITASVYADKKSVVTPKSLGLMLSKNHPEHLPANISTAKNEKYPTPPKHTP
ncbi:MAG: tyrosine-type recombinase/integrase [Luteolibacter sp.]